jgi:hypothetical protein
MVGISNDSSLNQDQKNFQIAQAVLNTASLVDPTGISGVVAAYTKPSCSLVAQQTSAASNFFVDGHDQQPAADAADGNQ